MKGKNTWSYSPYTPFLWEVGDIYICQVVPSENAIHLEWLDIGEETYSVFCRKRDVGDFSHCGDTKESNFDITGLECGSDYEFYVCASEKRSRIRLAKTGKSVGIVVNYLHPEDDAYFFSGRYLCSPSLLKLPCGALLASMDVYAKDMPQNLTLIFRSEDGGNTWHYLSELMPCFWGKLFLHGGDVYMLSVSTEYGDLLIGKSCDGGKTFSAPTVLLRGSNGKSGCVGVHKNPQPLVYHNGRIYCTLEWGSWKNTDYYHAAMVMSAKEDADLLLPESWHFTLPAKYNPEWKGTAKDGVRGNIEGTLAVAPNGKLYNFMRYQTEEKKILAYLIDENDPDAEISYSHPIDFPANLSKFMIKKDEKSGKYYSVANRRIDSPKTQRNLLSLFVSNDLEEWCVVCDLLDFRDEEPEKIGFQYVDFSFDEDDIIFLCRTAMNGAHNFHDSNYSTFHRIKKFRKL